MNPDHFQAPAAAPASVSPPPGPGTAWRISMPIVTLLAGFAIGIFVGVITIAFGGTDDDAGALGAIAGSLAFLVLAWAVFLRLPVHERRYVLASRGQLAISVLIGLGLGLAVRFATGAIVQIGEALDSGVCPALKEISEEAVPPELWHKVLIAIAVVALAPLGEELLFRGLLLRALARPRVLSFALAALISAVAFAVVHTQYWRAWPLGVAIAVFGLAAAYVYRWRGYPATVAMHFVFNIFAAVFLFGDFGLDTTVTCS